MELAFGLPGRQQELDNVTWVNIYDNGKPILLLRTVKGKIYVTDLREEKA